LVLGFDPKGNLLEIMYNESIMVALDTLSANYVQSVSIGTHKTPSEVISDLVREKIAVAS